MQEKSDISGWRRLHRLKCCSQAVFACLCLILALAGVTTTLGIPIEPGRLPASLDPWTQTYPPGAAAVLKDLKRGADHLLGGRYAAALDALPGENAAKETVIGDYILLYRAKTCLMMGRNSEALDAYRRLEKQNPDSALVREAILGECQTFLKLHNPEAVLALLGNPGIKTGVDTLYYQARALHESGEKKKAADLYLQIFSEYPTSQSALLAEKYLLSLAPGSLTGARNYTARLLRAENLLKAGETRKARVLLFNLGKASPPNSSSFEKRNLLFAEAEHHLGKTASALSLLHKVASANPKLQAKAIYLEGACCRRLNREQEFLALRDKALTLYPNSSYTEDLFYSAATYFDVNFDRQKAQEAYKAIHDNFPRGRYAERAQWKLALFAYLDARYEDAARGFWNYLLEYRNPLSAAQAAYWLGSCYKKMGDFEHAKQLYLRVQALANNSYYGQQARTAESSLGKSGNSSPAYISGVDFKQVIKACEGIKTAPIALKEPEAGAARVIERAGQLLAAGLLNPAISELRWGMRKYPQSEFAISYVMSRVYESKADYNGVISCLRKTFSEYNALPQASLPEEIWQLLFPVKYWPIISTQSAKAGVDSELILGVIRQESSFFEKARSSANARGLMQILPSTATKLARQTKIKRYNVNKLFQANENITLGVSHLASLLQRFGKEELALAAYNAGASRVVLWLKEFGETDIVEFVERIPFSETRNYVKQVLSNKIHYTLQTKPASYAIR